MDAARRLVATFMLPADITVVNVALSGLDPAERGLKSRHIGMDNQ